MGLLAQCAACSAREFPDRFETRATVLLSPTRPTRSASDRPPTSAPSATPVEGALLDARAEAGVGHGAGRLVGLGMPRPQITQANP